MSDGIRLLCQNCRHVWSYTGERDHVVTCPNCTYNVYINNRELDLQEVPVELVDHLKGQDLSEDQIRVWNFHLAMRNNDGLEAGTRIEYVKAAHRIFVEGMDPEDVSNGSATIKKMTELLEDNESTSTTEDDN